MRQVFIGLALALAATAPAYAKGPIEGRWLTQDKKAIVTIGKCGGSVCGMISKILAPTPDGPPHDDNNPDPKLRKRPIQGLPVLTGFKADGDRWRGQIYSPEEGKTYRSILTRNGNAKLKVQGCIGPFCQTQYWTAAK